MIQRIKLNILKLTEFRNYDSLLLKFDTPCVVILGENGIGKTNILEAISFLSPGRGLRLASYRDIRRIGSSSNFSIFADVEGITGPAEILIKLEVKDNTLVRRLRINGVKVRGVDELNNYLRINWLVPSMDRIFSGPVTDRRRFLDRMVFSFDPRHGSYIINFEKLMRDRNRLLTEGRFDPSWLSAIESQMAELGIAIERTRAEMISKLSLLIADVESSQKKYFPSARLGISGFMDNKLDNNILELQKEYAAILCKYRKRDAIAGRTLEGPHRSDLIVYHSENNLKAHQSSTGEQKVLLMSIFLAHARLISSTTGFRPILLLDEIAAHLDKKRRAVLFDIVNDIGAQVFMTGSDKEQFSTLACKARFIQLSNNNIDYN
ncbi:DNA recombination and repair protein RecF [Liberibacter crescens BT-1]|uniref:DNA replication and repair protein RecF n=1 Tax=Liberibacter crescens (strain BT-1) TaxID=1215343 RepID=L0EUJ9_LIBCB|nr:DNA replication/repair protein RecF [Liberibacter crescens]AGA64046.1 DNA recombination and repair protein RecF [Liberibacter crescens BT-1]AMC12350.1 recombinase RecF [Liberibacter crescens]